MNDSFRYIHAADLHVDSPLRGLSNYEGIPGDVIRNAPREAFTTMVDKAIEERVDFIVEAGDVLDGELKDVNTPRFLVRQYSRLKEAGIPVYRLRGNHDAASEVTQLLKFPSNVHEFGTRKPQTFEIPALRVALHGQSFKEPAVFDNLAAQYPAPVAGYFNIGVLHTALGGHGEHKPYAPCTVSELVAKGYDYWALGHIHQYLIVNRDPWVVYPGNSQGRSVRECGPKGAVIVEVRGSDVSVERLYLDSLRWHVLELDVSSCHDFDAVLVHARRALEACFEQHSGGKPLVTRVRLTGTSPAHGILFSQAAKLRNELIGQALQVNDSLWIEKVVRDTLPPALPQDAAVGGEALSELLSYIQDARASPEFQQELKALLDPEVAKMEHDAVEGAPLLAALRDGQVATLLDRAAANAAGRLRDLGGAA